MLVCGGYSPNTKVVKHEWLHTKPTWHQLHPQAVYDLCSYYTYIISTREIWWSHLLQHSVIFFSSRSTAGQEVCSVHNLTFILPFWQQGRVCPFTKFSCIVLCAFTAGSIVTHLEPCATFPPSHNALTFSPPMNNFNNATEHKHTTAAIQHTNDLKCIVRSTLDTAT